MIDIIFTYMDSFIRTHDKIATHTPYRDNIYVYRKFTLRRTLKIHAHI